MAQYAERQWQVPGQVPDHASQALIDLEEAARRARAPGGEERVAAPLRRVEALLTLLEGHLTVLDHLPVESFAAFRPLLDEASAGQSQQFARLFDRIGAPHCGVYGSDAERQQASESNDTAIRELTRALRSAVTRWKVVHLLLVERLIGDEPGTGGTSGLAFLRSRIALPPVGGTSAPGRDATAR